MESLFGWVGDLIRALLRIVPSFTLIRYTHRGVAFRHKGLIVGLFNADARSCETIELSPGLHWYWPVTTEIDQISVKRQTIKLACQGLESRDGCTLSVTGVVVVSLDSALKALCETTDFWQTIEEIAESVIATVVAPKTLVELKDAAAGFNDELTDRIRDALAPYGVHVENAFLRDFSRCQVLRIMGGSPDVAPYVANYAPSGDG